MNQSLPLASGCTCGEHETQVPTLVAGEIPHAIRHGAIIGALHQLPAGGSMDLVAPHDPVPLINQIEQLSPGGFERTYLVEGPQDWTIRFTRR